MTVLGRSTRKPPAKGSIKLCLQNLRKKITNSISYREISIYPDEADYDEPPHMNLSLLQSQLCFALSVLSHPVYTFL